ncbi:MAG: MFS transporter [Pseudonocardiales bacterium]|nr:NarK/NasA family nitrate transporter [Actinomycetota bacterium]PZS18643.1 MAG: MFS transporter [Pseudonocardiales bacterium]
MSTTEATTPAEPAPAHRGRWIDHWEPEDPDFWAKTGKRVAARNLFFSIFAEHIGFSIWVMWSVLVLFMGPKYGLSPADKFLLVALPNLVGSLLRVPYTFAVAIFGGRNWTIVSAGMLLVPSIAAAIVLQPGVSFTTLLVVATLAGVGGGNFASSMTNINTYYPERLKGVALGLNAGGGNIGVAVVQLVGLLIIALAGTSAPRLLLGIYIPLVVVAVACAALFMNNLSSVRNDTGAAKDALKERQLWIMSFLYIGTFGSFIGYSFAFGLVLQSQFHRTPLQAAAVTFIGPLLGSLIRPVGGWLSDRINGSIVTFWNFIAMAGASVLIIIAAGIKSLPMFTIGFIALFVLTGIGNGSTYKMIPSIFRAKADIAIAAGEDRAAALASARRITGATIGIVAAVGALGGFFINLAFRQSFQATGSGVVAFYSFLAFYAACAAVTYVVYLRRAEEVSASDSSSRRLVLEGV